MARPEVILVNGCSSSGKSSICRRLQARLTPPHVLTGLDDFVFRLLPPQLHGTEEGVRFGRDPDGGVPVLFGPAGEAMQRAFHRAVAAMAAEGLPVIVDEVILSRSMLDDWLAALAGRDVFFVGVDCDLAEVERREAARGDRQPGQARSHHHLVHAHGDYDLRVDTTRTPAAACVDEILAALEAVGGASAFERLANAG